MVVYDNCIHFFNSISDCSYWGPTSGSWPRCGPRHATWTGCTPTFQWTSRWSTNATSNSSASSSTSTLWSWSILCCTWEFLIVHQKCQRSLWCWPLPWKKKNRWRDNVRQVKGLQKWFMFWDVWIWMENDWMLHTFVRLQSAFGSPLGLDG